MEIKNRKRILHKYEENPNMSFSMIGKTLGISKSTVRDVINRFKSNLSVDRAKGSGRKTGYDNKKMANKIVSSIKRNPGLSDGDRAKIVGTSTSSVRRIRIQAGFKSYHAIKVPNRNDKQESKTKSRSRLLYDKVLTKFVGCYIMDDETYVKLDLNQIPGTKFYVAKERLNVDNRYKHIKMAKYAKKVMIWQAICSCGKRSFPFITSKTMTSNLYITECLQNRLLPLIRQHDAPIKFWPDLASCHYSRVVINWYKDNKVDVIPKFMNPPNCPEFRPIERYWAIMKRKLKNTGRTIKNEQAMLCCWNRYAKELTEEDVRNIMRSIKGKVRNFIRRNDM